MAHALRHLLNIDVGLVEAVKEYHGSGTVSTQLVDERYGVSKVVAQLHDYGYLHRAADVAQDINVTLLKGTVSVVHLGLEGQNVHLEGVGTSGLNLTGKVNPVTVIVAVDTGDNGDIAYLLALANYIEVLVKFVLTEVSGQIVATLRREGGILHVVGLHQDLFFEKGLQYDSSSTGFSQFLVLGGAVSQS